MPPSVIPYRSTGGWPSSRSQRSNKAGGRGADPQTNSRTCDRSVGRSSSQSHKRWYIEGTPKNIVPPWVSCWTTFSGVNGMWIALPPLRSVPWRPMPRPCRWKSGSAILIPFTPENVVQQLTHGGTMFFGVPSMYQRLCDWLDERPTDLSHVRLFVCGSAPLPPALFERCERLLGQPPVERYGITEGGIVVTNPYDGPRQPGRVGYPFPGVEVRLGELDEVLLKGGQVFQGYWRNAKATEKSFTPDGFFKTGDVGEIAEDLTLAIRGRIKELIITGGFNVYPREVELVLEAHPAVQEAAVAGLPSEKWGEEVTAFVVPSGSAPLVESELIAFAQERLASYKCPKRVITLDRLPRNAMGKVQRSELAEVTRS